MVVKHASVNTGDKMGLTKAEKNGRLIFLCEIPTEEKDSQGLCCYANSVSDPDSSIPDPDTAF